MVSMNPKRVMAFFLVAILLKAVSASGGGLPDTHAPSGKAAESAPRGAGASALTDRANLGLDLGKLGRRVTGGSVYDMFSGAPKPESAVSEQEQTIQKKQQAARRAARAKTPPSPIIQTPVAPVPDPTPVAPIEPVVEAPPPPVPTPPFPFKYTGLHRLESGQTTYFLTKGNQLYTVEVGEILDQVYSIDSEEEGQLTVTYLPLERTQTISTGPPQ